MNPSAPSQHRSDLLEVILANLADGILVMDGDGKIIEANPAAAALFNRDVRSMINLPLWDLIPSYTRDAWLGAISKIADVGQMALTCSYPTPMGDLLHLDIRLTHFGCPGRDLVIASCRDISEQRRQEDQLRELADRLRHDEKLVQLNHELETQALHLRKINQALLDSEQRLRLAIATGRIGLWVWNSTDITNAGDWSDRLKEIFGLPLNIEVTHDVFLNAVHPQDRDRVNTSIMKALGGENGGHYETEYRALDPENGSIRWVTARGQAFFNEEGQPVRFIGTVMDITERRLAEEAAAQLNVELEQRIMERTSDLEQANKALQIEIEDRKKAEAALKESEQNLQLVLDTIPASVWIASPDGQLDYFNKYWVDYTGVPSDKASGWGWKDVIHPDDLPRLIEYWKKILSTGEHGVLEARRRRYDGVYRWFLFRAVPLYDNSGKILKWYGTNTDIEDVRVSERLARGQLEALTHSLSMLSQESEPEKFLEHILRTIGRLMKAHSLGVWDMNPATGRAELIANCENESLQFASPEQIQAASAVAPPLHDHPVWTEFFHSGEHCVIGDIEHDSAKVRLDHGEDVSWYNWRTDTVDNPNVTLMMKRLSASGVVRTLCVPLMIGGRVVGLISIRFVERRDFSSEELALAKALGHQAMLAIQLMRLSAQSRQSAVIAERNRMARDIHDTLAQGFTGVIIQLEAAADASSRGLKTETDQHIERAGDLARESLQEARHSVRALRPHALEDNNLCEALNALLKKLTQGTQMAAYFSVKGSPLTLPSQWEEHLLRIGQETLTNALRHANATRFNGILTFGHDDLTLEFHDNGCGFDVKTRQNGLGLIGIQERVESMNGHLIIESLANRGTTIRIHLLLSKKIPSSLIS